MGKKSWETNIPSGQSLTLSVTITVYFFSLLFLVFRIFQISIINAITFKFQYGFVERMKRF